MTDRTAADAIVAEIDRCDARDARAVCDFIRAR
jgi:hypothetical protein